MNKLTVKKKNECLNECNGQNGLKVPFYTKKNWCRNIFHSEIAKKNI